MIKFKNSWLEKDVDAVLDLFAEDVDYWETPFERIHKGADLRVLWKEILLLEDMRLDYEIVSADKERRKYGVRWHFSHLGGESAGSYLIGLNEQGLCTYFYHSAQSKK